MVIDKSCRKIWEYFEGKSANHWVLAPHIKLMTTSTEDTTDGSGCFLYICGFSLGHLQLLGIPQCVVNIVEMIQLAKDHLGMTKDQHFLCVV